MQTVPTKQFIFILTALYFPLNNDLWTNKYVRPIVYAITPSASRVYVVWNIQYTIQLTFIIIRIKWISVNCVRYLIGIYKTNWLRFDIDCSFRIHELYQEWLSYSTFRNENREREKRIKDKMRWKLLSISCGE